MSGAVTNEIEERRIVRLLARLSDQAGELTRADVADLIGLAAADARGSSRRRYVRLYGSRMATVAAAAAILLQLTLWPDRSDSSSHPPSGGHPAQQLVAFPGTALQLLLAHTERLDQT